MLDRDQPYKALIIGILLNGLGFPFNWWSGEDANRKKLMQETDFGLNWLGNLELVRAWEKARDKTNNRGVAHHSKDIVIEWANVPEWQSYAVKFLCSLFVYSSIAFILIIGGLIYVCSY